MKGTFLLVNIFTIFAIGKCYTKCYHCIDGRRGNNIPSCSHFFSNPTVICWNTDYCGKMVEVTNYHNYRQVVIYTCFDYEANMDKKNITESYNEGLFDKGVRSPYNGMDMQIFLCNSTLCNSASYFSTLGSFVPFLLALSLKLL